MRVLAVAALGSAVWATGALAAAPAGAVINGPCQATVKGIDVRPLSVSDPDAAIVVQPTETVSWTVDAPSAAASRELVLSYAGVDVVIDRDTSNGSSGGSRGGDANIDDYAWMGAGLYQVAGVAHLAGGGTCSGAVLIKVDGSPLGTLAGKTALILTVLGTLGIIVAAIRQGGGRLVRDIVDFVALSGVGDPAMEAPPPDSRQPVTTIPADVPPTGGEQPDPPGDDAPPRRPRRPPTAGTVPPAPVVDGPPASTTPTTREPAAGPPVSSGSVPPASASTPSADGAAPQETQAPPPIPGMATVSAAGSTAKALGEATEQLQGHIDELPISDEEKEKLKETLGLDKIKDKVDAVSSTVETVEHFEGMGTETVDTMNRWGVNANGINGLVWLRTMFEASGRLGQKATDDLVVPVVEPIAKVAEQAGVKVDAGEIARTLLPVQAVAEEGSKALLTASKNVLGGDNILGQLHQDPVVDEEWRAIRSFD